MKLKRVLLWLTAGLSLVMIILWQLLFSEVNYYVTSVAVLLLSMLPLLLRYERKRSSAREIALMATLIALAVVSRAAFFLVPQVKPIAAVVIVAAVCLGPQRGYIIGVYAAFISNFIFGQGMWTPYQMFALGMVGLVAGLLFHRKNKKRPPHWLLAAVGFVLAFAVYGLFVDISTVLAAYGNRVTLQGVLSVYAAGVSFSLLFGASTAVFLLLFGPVLMQKIDRIVRKFSLLPEAEVS
ncbi:MAG: ECF transporter S component [Eubacterium sp.]|nr:ECF transporter S component [Eubacterium sp.]